MPTYPCLPLSAPSVPGANLCRTYSFLTALASGWAEPMGGTSKWWECKRGTRELDSWPLSQDPAVLSLCSLQVFQGLRSSAAATAASWLFNSSSSTQQASLRCSLLLEEGTLIPDTTSLSFSSFLNPAQTSVNSALVKFSSVKPWLFTYCMSLKQKSPVLRDKWTFYMKTAITHVGQSQIPRLSEASLWYQWLHTSICTITLTIIY